MYGETSFEFITQMIGELDITGDDVFIDLGSGRLFLDLLCKYKIVLK